MLYQAIYAVHANRITNAEVLPCNDGEFNTERDAWAEIEARFRVELLETDWMLSHSEAIEPKLDFEYWEARKLLCKQMLDKACQKVQ
ncbi:MAG TPA: hypothetical protein DDW52_16650 [Planctomycetaceae bacterium]|nr:hypothetical protein [Planctomycetaceae bacterium]